MTTAISTAIPGHGRDDAQAQAGSAEREERSEAGFRQNLSMILFMFALFPWTGAFAVGDGTLLVVAAVTTLIAGLIFPWRAPGSAGKKAGQGLLAVVGGATLLVVLGVITRCYEAAHP